MNVTRLGQAEKVPVDRSVAVLPQVLMVLSGEAKISGKGVALRTIRRSRLCGIQGGKHRTRRTRSGYFDGVLSNALNE